MPTDDELRAVMHDYLRIDYYKTHDDDFANGEWWPVVFCQNCQQSWDASWGEFDESERLEPDNPWRLAAVHWITEHGKETNHD